MKKLRYLTAALCAVVLLCGFAFPAYASGEAWTDVEPAETRPVQTTAPAPDPTPAPTVEPTTEPSQPLAPDPTPTGEPTPAPEPTVTVPATPAVTPTGTGNTGNNGGAAVQKPAAATTEPEPSASPSEEGGATGGADWDGLTPVNPLTPDGQGSVLNNATGDEGKEFFTVTTADGEVFYLVIDRQKSGENVYFLNAVTVDDLMSLAEPGKEDSTAPIATPEPVPIPTPDMEPEPDPEPEQKGGGNMGTLILALAVVAVGGGAGWYFKIYRPKQQRAADLEEDDYPGGPEPGFEDGYGADPLWSGDGPEDGE